MQTIRNTREDIHDRLMDVLYGLLYHEIPQQAEDIMNMGERVDIDPDGLTDCDSREDFLQLRSLERTLENFEREEYL